MDAGEEKANPKENKRAFTPPGRIRYRGSEYLLILPPAGLSPVHKEKKMIIAYDAQSERPLPYNGFFRIGGNYQEESENDFVFRVGDRVRNNTRIRVHWGDGQAWNTQPGAAGLKDRMNVSLFCDRIGTIVDIQRWCETREGTWDENGFTRFSCRVIVRWDDGEVEKLPYVSWLYPDSYIPERVILVPPNQWKLGEFQGLTWK